MKKLWIYLSMVIVLLGSCKKYEEGPGISLRSKEKRLCQEWELKKTQINGVTESVDVAYYYWDIEKDGDLIVELGYDWGYGVEKEVLDFTWEWSSDKEELEITETYDYKNGQKLPMGLFKGVKSKGYTETLDCQIVKLKYKELIIEYSEDGDKYRMEFEQR